MHVFKVLQESVSKWEAQRLRLVREKRWRERDDGEHDDDDDDDVYYYIRWRLKLEGETENMSVCTKERKGVTAAVLMATPCTNSLGGESGGQKHEGCGGRSACWKYAAVSGSGAGGRPSILQAWRMLPKVKINYIFFSYRGKLHLASLSRLD